MIHDWGMGQKLYYEPEKQDAEREINILLTNACQEARADRRRAACTHAEARRSPPGARHSDRESKCSNCSAARMWFLDWTKSSTRRRSLPSRPSPGLLPGASKGLTLAPPQTWRTGERSSRPRRLLGVRWSPLPLSNYPQLTKRLGSRKTGFLRANTRHRRRCIKWPPHLLTRLINFAQI